MDGSDTLKEKGDIPARLQCAYCLRNFTHGGECEKPRYNDAGCLAFKFDPKGCIRTNDFKIQIPLYFNFPFLNEWDDEWQIFGYDTELRVTKIYGFKWNTKKGNLIVHCRCDYYVNEYHEKYKNTQDKPKLKLVKG